MTQSDSELLQRYALEKAEPAFAELVRRHINMVFSAALRLTDGDRPLAEDVTQDVFTDLARKASRLTAHTSLAGWLYTSTRYCARDARRSSRRRQIREQQAFAMNQLLQPEPSLDWGQLRPLLDDAMHSLNESDRQAVLLRFFNRLPLAEVGARLSVNENTARMRVDRALEKLRRHLEKRGFSSTATLLATMLSDYAVQSAPMGLAATVTSAAVTAGATAAAGGLATLIGLKGMLAAAAVVAILAATPTIRRFASAQWLAPTAAQTRPQEKATAQMAALDGSPGTASLSAQSAGPFLTLHFLNRKNDMPLPRVKIVSRAWSEGVLDNRTVTANAEGVARVFYPVGTTNLILITEKDGYADTQLAWEPGKGETIPESYTLRPDPAAVISGRVVDEQGQPIAGATVRWSLTRTYDAAGRLSPESHTLGEASVTTDADGRWRLERAADDIIHRLTAGVTDPQHGSYFLEAGPRPAMGQQDSEMDQKLRVGSAIFTLNSACAVTGTVVDTNGKPVAGARILVGPLGDQRRRQTTTLADGSFTIDGCVPEESPVTAEADGFAPASTLPDLATNSSPVRLTILPAQTLRLRVARPDGVPIAGANVLYDRLSFGNPLRPQDYPNSPSVRDKLRSGRPVQAQDYPDLAVAQVKFNAKTGTDGRLSWTNAPSGEIMLLVNAPGFTAIDDAPVRADGEEHLITLTRGTLVTGTVRDDSTGAAIPRFRVILGFPEIRPALERTNIRWVRNRAQEFRDGTYSQDLVKPLVMGGAENDYVLKFEAVDYEPFVSRIFDGKEGGVRLDVSLRPSKWSTITVLKPNGQPAGGADVGLVSPGSNLKLVPGHFLHDPLSTALQKTYLDGSFRLASDPRVTQVIIACDDGYLSATPASLKTNSTVQLEPWGRIEGTCLAHGKPVAGQVYKFGLENESLDTVMCAFDAYEVTSDVQGHFTIQRAPPGADNLVPVTIEVGPDGTTLRESIPGVRISNSYGRNGKLIKSTKEQVGQIPVTVWPGQTATVTVQP